MNHHCCCQPKPFPGHPDGGDPPVTTGGAAVASLAELQARYGLAPKVETLPEPSREETAAGLCRHGRIKLKEAATRWLDDQVSPREFFDRLVRHDCLADARRVLAHAMPKRRALWWGCLCGLDACRDSMPPAVSEVIDAVVRFVRQPNEENRRIMLPLGKRVGVNTLAGSLAMATFFSRGSVSRPGLPEVAPRPCVTGRLVGVAVYLASVTRDPKHYKARLRGYLAWGRDIACGKNLWHAPLAIESTRVDLAHGSRGLQAVRPTTGGCHNGPDFTAASNETAKDEHHAQ